MIEYFKHAIREESSVKVEAFVRENYDDNCIMPKFQIYAIAERYKDLKQYLFSSNNPFQKWILYSDLYYLIEKNNDVFTEEECRKLVDWIMESNYEMNEDKQCEYICIIRYDFLFLLSQKHCLAKEYLNNITGIDNISKYPDIYERNCSIRFKFRLGGNDKELADQMTVITFSEIAKLLENEDLKEFTVYDYGEAVKTICHNDPDKIYDEIDSIALIPQKYLPYIIQGLCSNPQIKYADNLINVIKMICTIIGDEVENQEIIKAIAYESFKFFSSLFSEFDSNTYMCKLYDVMFECIRSRQKRFMKFFSFPSDFSMDRIIVIVQDSWFSLSLKILIRIAVIINNEEYRRKTINLIDSVLSSNSNDALLLVKSMLSMEVDQLYIIAPSWLSENQEIILSEYCSFISFVCSNSIHNIKEAFIIIKMKKYIDRLLIDSGNSTDYEYICVRLVRFIVWLYFEGEDINDWLLTPLIKVRNAQIINELIINITDSIVENNRKQDLISVICGIMNQNGIIIDNYTFDSLANIALLFSNLDSSIWACIEKGSQNKIDFLSDSMVDLVDKQWDINRNNAVKILVNMVKNTIYIRGEIDGNEKLKKLIKRTQDDPSLKKEFNTIHSKLIEYGYTDLIKD